MFFFLWAVTSDLVIVTVAALILGNVHLGEIAGFFSVTMLVSANTP